MSAENRLIVALDEEALAPALRVARQVRGLARTVKIGSVLFTAAGPKAIGRTRQLGFDVMLDLKFFDIPNTVEQSCRAAAGHRVSLLTVHAAGGRAMLEAAVRGVRDGHPGPSRTRPRVLAVTLLTSVAGTSPGAVHRRVLALAGEAIDAGCDGVVASAQEARALRRAFGNRRLIVCPGIRSAASARGDQRRVSTPREAIADGADFLVVGRPITHARNPRAAARTILNEMEDRDAC